MNWNWWARTIVSCMVGAVLTGCATADRPAAAAQAKVSGGNQHCDWSFDLGKFGKMDETSLRVAQKSADGCKEHKWGTSKKLYIGDGTSQWEVEDLPFVEFFLKGTCRRCWPNTNGGMTCIEYPGNC